MKNIIGKILSLAIMVCLSANLFAQVNNEVEPVVGTWEGEDVFIEKIDTTGTHISAAYLQLEPQVLADIDWLNNSPLGENQTMRDDKSRFVLMWMSGSPTVNIGIDDRIVKFTGSQPWLLMAYMTGWTKYALKHNYSADSVECTTAALTNVVSFYEKNRKGLSKSKEVEKYAKMLKDNTLKEYVSSILNKPVAK